MFLIFLATFFIAIAKCLTGMRREDFLYPGIDLLQPITARADLETRSHTVVVVEGQFSFLCLLFTPSSSSHSPRSLRIFNTFIDGASFLIAPFY